MGRHCYQPHWNIRHSKATVQKWLVGCEIKKKLRTPLLEDPLTTGFEMEADVIIAIMGVTGVGKSTFIKTITGREDIAVGHGLFSGTLRHPKFL